MGKLHLAGTVDDSIVDGPGFRYTIFTQGCPHNCVGCHNPETHSFDAGKFVDIDELVESIAKNILLSGVTFSGGEPFCQIDPLIELSEKILQKTNLNIMIYTGYTLENLLAMQNERVIKLLKMASWLVDGKFEQKLRDLTLDFRGSKNQRIIDLKKFFQTNDICSSVIDSFS